MKKPVNVTESLQLGIILSLSGGFMDAYSYVCRGQVFANAQTGNILLLGTNLSEGNFSTAFQYLYPILSFTIGIVITDFLRRKASNRMNMHWMQLSILAEALILLSVAFVSSTADLLANCLVSFACGIQVESFRMINGNGVATTMCIGNLRTATEYLCEYTYTKDITYVKKGALFFGIILVFVIGAIIGNFAVRLWQEQAIVLSSILLFIGFIFLSISKKRESINSVEYL